jgi:RNA polymerase sigma factor (sigma-70 family)
MVDLDAGRNGPAELERLLRQHRAPLLGFARRHIPRSLRVVLEPQDVLQDAFIDALRRWTQFKPGDPDAGRRWLTAIVLNHVLNAVRAQGTAKRGGKRATGEEAAASASELVDQAVDDRTPFRSAAARDFTVALERSISRLPPDRQRVIRLRLIEGNSIEAIAADIGRTERAVHNLYNRALKALRRELGSASRFQ